MSEVYDELASNGSHVIFFITWARPYLVAITATLLSNSTFPSSKAETLATEPMYTSETHFTQRVESKEYVHIQLFVLAVEGQRHKDLRRFQKDLGIFLSAVFMCFVFFGQRNHAYFVSVADQPIPVAHS